MKASLQASVTFHQAAQMKPASTQMAAGLLSTRNVEQIDLLATALGQPAGVGAERVVDELCAVGSHAVGRWLRGGKGVSYLELLFSVARQLKIPEAPNIGDRTLAGISWREMDLLAAAPITPVALSAIYRQIIYSSCRSTEQRMLLHLTEQLYDAATPADRARLDAAIEAESARHGKSFKSVKMAAAALAAGNAGGFATYTLASTILSTLSLGTLPFGAYLGVSSMLSFVLGPPGAVALAGLAAWKLGAPKMDMVVPATLRLAMNLVQAEQHRANSAGPSSCVEE